MAVKTINLRDFSEALEDFSAEHIDTIREGVVRGVVRSLPKLVEDSPVDTGLYAASWDIDIGKEYVAVGNFAPHAPIIEYGARPFKPPIGPLLAWAKRVLKDGSQPPNYSQAVWSLAVGTQKKIMREGIKPRGVMQKNIPMILRNIEEELRKVA